MKQLLRWTIVLLLAIAIVFLIAFSFNFLYCFRVELVRLCESTHRGFSGAEKQEIKQLFRKHGVTWAKEGKDGRLWFERNGEWCRLK